MISVMKNILSVMPNLPKLVMPNLFRHLNRAREILKQVQDDIDKNDNNKRTYKK